MPATAAAGLTLWLTTPHHSGQASDDLLGSADKLYEVTKSMSEKNGSVVLPEVLPKKGVLYFEETSHMILCKPRIMPLKSITLEKMEQIQKDAQEVVKNQMNHEAESNNSY
ncbi:hypothetical protein ACHWQZ_G014565 [Mnemiopsis leidyi]